jgi:hypothetical protein
MTSKDVGPQSVGIYKYGVPHRKSTFYEGLLQTNAFLFKCLIPMGEEHRSLNFTSMSLIWTTQSPKPCSLYSSHLIRNVIGPTPFYLRGIVAMRVSYRNEAGDAGVKVAWRHLSYG